MTPTTMLTPPPRMLSPGAIADLLGVSRRTVYRWIAARELQAARTSGTHGKLLIARADLERFLEARRV